jgi:Ca2+-binding EF-hand superfamily protein
MDAEGNGAVSMDEFLSFMLITMGKVEREDIEQLKELYRRLDSNNDRNLNIHDLFNTTHGRSID